MGGFFGAVSKTDCVCDLYYGTDYHSHLGTKRGGLAIQGRDGSFTRKIHDITNAQFRSKFDNDIPRFSGVAGIGSISDGEAQPLLISSKFGNFAIVTVGRINNIDKIVNKAFDLGHTHLTENGDGEVNPTEIVAMLICTKKSITEGIVYAQKIISGSCSLLILTDGKIYAARDRFGRTPVILGKKEDNMAVTMETTAFPNLDYTIDRELGPGEVVEITADGSTTLVAPGDTMKLCSFFWVYYGYPSSIYEGVTTEVARYRNGTLLAEADRDMLGAIDSICGIPDSGIPHAIGYSIAAGKPYQRAFVKYTPTWPRSFMPQNQKLRDLVARMKLIPICDLIKGKRLLFCDDSIVRGTQLKDTVKRLYADGVKEVHMRSACPPLVYGCPFINFSRSRSEFDLATRRAIAKIEGTTELTEEMIKPYLEHGSEKYNAMVDEIRKALNLTTLRFQSLEKLISAIGLPAEKVCTYCWNGCDVEDTEAL
ncbi:MAG: amidophosphoribosyltransferase [Lentisphaeria bacterium]|nr:amidophosphoribosyltransferase [Lentisphaeria bacterium]